MGYGGLLLLSISLLDNNGNISTDFAQLLEIKYLDQQVTVLFVSLTKCLCSLSYGSLNFLFKHLFRLE